jgi:hypothetical protein
MNTELQSCSFNLRDFEIRVGCAAPFGRLTNRISPERFFILQVLRLAAKKAG